MRLGIFGGTFDPVHYGHLLLAECCRVERRLDQVWFMPANVQPHKQQIPLTPPTQRLEMVELAIAGHEDFVAAPHELERGGVSYTVDSLQAIHDARPDDALFLLLGADALADLPNWREPKRICQLASIVAIRRADQAEPDFAALTAFAEPDRVELFRSEQVEMPLIGLSASDIRRRVAAGQSIRYRTPRAVEMYIQTHGLYARQQ